MQRWGLVAGYEAGAARRPSEDVWYASLANAAAKARSKWVERNRARIGGHDSMLLQYFVAGREVTGRKREREIGEVGG